MQTIQIAKLYRTEGVGKNPPYRPYTKVDIYDENGVKYTAFDSFGKTSAWAVGQQIEVDVVESEYQGKVQYKIEFPKRESFFSNKLGNHETRLEKIEKHLGLPTNGTLDVRPVKETSFNLKPVITNETTDTYTEDLPF